MSKKIARMSNPEWAKFYSIILDVMNKKFYNIEPVTTGYAYPSVRKSIDGKEEYYAFFISTSNVIREKNHDDYIFDAKERYGDENAKLLDWASSEMCQISLDDLAELNTKLKEAGAEKVYFQTDEMYVREQVAIYNFIEPNRLLLLIKC